MLTIKIHTKRFKAFYCKTEMYSSGLLTDYIEGIIFSSARPGVLHCIGRAVIYSVCTALCVIGSMSSKNKHSMLN